MWLGLSISHSMTNGSEKDIWNFDRAVKYNKWILIDIEH